ncbi:MAG: DUF1987 domain-containing protein [Bernardetiaceae bacterium]|jgi:hypothetical protein|nr:DUF1987 domain-containing protein [Bernardetiaceae bacterium]
MENFVINGSTYIPTVNFDAVTHVLEIAGESYHEYTVEFYQPIMEWLRNYLAQPGRTLVFNFKMTYFNTSTSRRFLEIFDMLEDYQNNQQGKVTVNWYYQTRDLDMLENGEEYAEDLSLPFNFIKM